MRNAPLGPPTGNLIPLGGGNYQRTYQFGLIKTQSIDVPSVETFYAVDIFVAAVKCFGSEDPGGPFAGGEGDDEPYLIVTTINPAHISLDGDVRNVARSWRSPTFTEISRGDIFCQDLPVFESLVLGRHGPILKIALFDHEHGDPETLRREIEERGQKLAREATSAAAAVAGVSVDEAQADQAMDSEIGKLIQDIPFDTITNILKDDKIDEKTWHLSGPMLQDWVDTGFTRHSDVQYPPSEIPSHIKTNFPRENIFDRTWLFSGGGGSYKVYLRLIPSKITRTF